MKKIFWCFVGWDGTPVARKRLVATVSRREGACNRAGEPSVTFCGKGGASERADDAFYDYDIKKRRSKADFAPTWRRRRDSNPRTAYDGYTISSRAPSTGLGDFSMH